MRRAQSLIEYAMVIVVVSAAFMAINGYMKRGIQAQIRMSADELGRQEESEELDLTKGRLKVSGQRMTSEAPGQRKREYAGGRQRDDINERSEVLAFNEDPLEGKVDKDKNTDGDFFEQDKRGGSRFLQGWSAVD
ncbi:hypothetical protein EPN16_03230 [bacterium]|nr:MAG: hypothetical protein EPN16_03230 [bacterium]